MFGLGWIEMLVIGAVISLIAGPAVLRKLLGHARALDQAKRDFPGPGALDRLLGGAPEDAGSDDLDDLDERDDRG